MAKEIYDIYKSLKFVPTYLLNDLSDKYHINDTECRIIRDYVLYG